MTVLPESQPTAPAAGQTANPLTDAVIKAAVDNAIHESRRDSTTPPARKPERPAMSSKATDMIAFGGMFLMVSAGGGIIMVASDFADPTVIGMICAAPAVLALPILALARLAKRVKPEPEIHHHYTGPVYQDQRNVHSKNTGVWVKNTNQQ
jgi:hypothetical protein